MIIHASKNVQPELLFSCHITCRGSLPLICHEPLRVPGLHGSGCAIWWKRRARNSARRLTYKGHATLAVMNLLRIFHSLTLSSELIMQRPCEVLSAQTSPCNAKFRVCVCVFVRLVSALPAECIMRRRIGPRAKSIS